MNPAVTQRLKGTGPTKRRMRPDHRREWPKGPYRWQVADTLFVSVPFTWNLPAVKAELEQGSMYWKSARVGGPAVDLMPAYLQGIRGVEVGGSMPG